MKAFTILALLFFSPLFTLAIPPKELARDPLTIVITTFGPFGGSSSNRTETLAPFIQQRFLQNHPGARVVICPLPVVFDQAADVALKCIRQNAPHPDLVVSLGEHSCDIRLETFTHNLDHQPGFPDNNGQTRASTRISADGPQTIAMSAPVDRMYCNVPAETRQRTVTLSATPGGFVCNNTAYRLSSVLAAEQIPFSFIHVPNSNCTQIDNAATAHTLSTMISGVFKPGTNQVLDHCVEKAQAGSLPFSPLALRNFAQFFEHSNEKAAVTPPPCANEFYHNLSDQVQGLLQ